MALVIEDGSLVAGANSFLTRAEIIAYAAARGVTIPDDDASDVHAIAAMDFFWSLPCLKGELVDAAQTTPFPRMGLVDGDTVDGYEFSIPDGVKRAFAQLTLDSFNGIALTSSSAPSQVLKRSKVGPIEREFHAPADLNVAAAPQLTVAMAALGPWLCSTANGFSLRSVRG